MRRPMHRTEPTSITSVTYEPDFDAVLGSVHYFTSSARSGDCESCGTYIEAETPHRHWVDVEGGKHLRCMKPQCTPTLDERSAEVVHWRPTQWDVRRLEPYRITLRLDRTEVCSRCGQPLHRDDRVLYFKAEFLRMDEIMGRDVPVYMGKDLLCESCGDWYQSNENGGSNG